MKKLGFIFLIVVLNTSCGTFSIKNLDQSDAALDFAKMIFSKVDYTQLNEKLSLPKSSIKSVGPVLLYSATNKPLSVEQNEWNYVQRIKRSDGLECYSYLHIRTVYGNKFEVSSNSPGKFYCFEDKEKFQTTNLF